MQNVQCPKCGSFNVVAAGNGCSCQNCGTVFTPADEQTVLVNPVTPPAKKGFNWKKFGIIAAPILAIAGIAAGLIFWLTGVRTDHLAAIPTDAPVVMKMNVGEVLKKSEISELKEFQEYLESSVEDEIEDAKLKALCKEVIKNPKKSGFDVMSPVALAVTDLENPQMIFVAPVDSRKKLEENIETIIKATGSDDYLKLDKSDDYTVIKAGRDKEVSMAFNNKRFVVVVGIDNKAKSASKFVMQEKSNSILSQDAYKDFVNTKDDVAFFFNYDPILGFLKKNVDDLGFDPQLLKGTSVFASLNFEDGKAVMRVKTNPGEKFNKYVEKVWKEPNSKLLTYVPKDAIAVGQFAIGDISTAIKAGLNTLSRRDTQEFLDGLSELMGHNVTVAEFSKLFSGSIAGYATLTDNNPDWGVIIMGKEELADATHNVLDKMYEEEQGSDYQSIKRSGNCYILDPNSSSPSYVTIDGTLITISNTKGNPSSNFSKQEAAEYIKNGGYYVNLEKLWANPEVKRGLKNEPGATNFAKLFKNVHFSVKEGGLEAELVVEMTDGKKNALAQIVTGLYDLYKAVEKDRKNRKDDYDDWDSYNTFVDDTTGYDYMDEYAAPEAYYDDYDSIW